MGTSQRNSDLGSLQILVSNVEDLHSGAKKYISRVDIS